LFEVYDSQSDIDWTKYSLDNGNTWEIHVGSWPFNVYVGEGEFNLLYYSSDVEGNEEKIKGPYKIKIDSTEPDNSYFSFSIILGPMLIAILNIGLVKDRLSGLDRVDFYLNEYFHHTVNLQGWPKNLGRLVLWLFFEPRVYDNCTGIVYDMAGNSAEF
jgi:hypothetical protein